MFFIVDAKYWQRNSGKEEKMKEFLNGVGVLIGKLADYIPGSAERRRGQIEDLKRKIDACRDPVAYRKLADKLRKLEAQAINK